MCASVYTCKNLFLCTSELAIFVLLSWYLFHVLKYLYGLSNHVEVLSYLHGKWLIYNEAALQVGSAAFFFI